MDDDEPIFKYLRLGSHTSSILAADAATCLRIADKFLVLGTSSGHLHLLDFTGSAVRSFSLFSSQPITDISLDSRAEYVACASTDKLICLGLYVEDRTEHVIRGLSCAAIDPLYSKKGNRRVVSGSKTGVLALHTRGWFSQSKDQIIHQGEGPIESVLWSNNRIAWSNQVSIKIMDAANLTPVASISKVNLPPPFPRAFLAFTHEELLVSYGPMIRVFSIDKSVVTLSHTLEEGVESCGVATFGNDLVLLVKNADNEFEFRLMDRSLEELSVDILTSGDRLVHFQDDEAYYIHNEHDVIVARVRDLDDHIQYLLSKGQLEEAYKEVSRNTRLVKSVTLVEVGERLIQQLLAEKEWDKAATYVREVCGDKVELWDKWVRVFAKLDSLDALVDFLPSNLSVSTYTEVLLYLIRKRADERVTELLKRWPRERYDMDTVLSASDGFIRAFLCRLKGDYASAFRIYLDLSSDELFNATAEHGLYSLFLQHLGTVIEKYPFEKACALLTSHIEQVPIQSVMDALASRNEYYLYVYLHTLHAADPKKSAPYADTLIRLYAVHCSGALLQFLKTSSDYHLQHALDVCHNMNLHREKVYVLGRMGNLAEALNILIGTLRDVKAAIEFLRENAPEDKDLWDLLMERSLESGDAIGELLENGVENPVVLIRKIPPRKEIPHVKERILRVLNDASLWVSLQSGCRDVLRNDCLELCKRLLDLQKKGRMVEKPICESCREIVTRGALVVCGCGHMFHTACLRRDSGQGSNGSEALTCTICKEKGSLPQKAAAVTSGT